MFLKEKKGPPPPATASNTSTKWWRRFSLFRCIFWLLLMVPAYALGWLELVLFVSLLSLWALVETAFSAWRSDEVPELKLIVRMLKIVIRLQWRASHEREEISRKLDELLQSQGVR